MYAKNQYDFSIALDNIAPRSLTPDEVNEIFVFPDKMESIEKNIKDSAASQGLPREDYDGLYFDLDNAIKLYTNEPRIPLGNAYFDGIDVYENCSNNFIWIIPLRNDKSAAVAKAIFKNTNGEWDLSVYGVADNDWLDLLLDMSSIERIILDSGINTKTIVGILPIIVKSYFSNALYIQTETERFIIPIFEPRPEFCEYELYKAYAEEDFFKFVYYEPREDDGGRLIGGIGNGTSLPAQSTNADDSKIAQSTNYSFLIIISAAAVFAVVAGMLLFLKKRRSI